MLGQGTRVTHADTQIVAVKLGQRAPVVGQKHLRAAKQAIERRVGMIALGITQAHVHRAKRRGGHTVVTAKVGGRATHVHRAESQPRVPAKAQRQLVLATGREVAQAAARRARLEHIAVQIALVSQTAHHFQPRQHAKAQVHRTKRPLTCVAALLFRVAVGP